MPPAKSSFSASRRCIDLPRSVFAQLIVAPARKIQERHARRSVLPTQKFAANVFQKVGGALHTYLARQNQIFILDAQDAFVADIHIGLDDRFPQRGAMPVTNGAKFVRSVGALLLLDRKVQNPIPSYILTVKNRILHVTVENLTLFSKEIDYFARIAAL